MSDILAPSTAARLLFSVTDPTTGEGVTDLAHGDITSAGYATTPDGGATSATTSVSLTSTAAVTDALATGQLIEIGLGVYAIDVPAVGTSGKIQAVVTVTGYDVRAVVYRIDQSVSSRATQTSVDALPSATLTALGTGTWLTAIPWNAAWDAEVQSECNDALVALELDSALIAQGAERAVSVDVSHRVHSHVYDMQANTLTASALAADAVAEIQSGLSIVTLAQIGTEVAGRLIAYDPPTKTEMDAAFAAIVGADGDTLESLSDQIDGVGGGSGLTGPNNVRLLISDSDGAPIQNALVSMYRTGATGTVKTGEDGIAEFTVVSATWSVSIVADGFIGITNVLVVSTHKDQTYILPTSASNLPTPAGTVTGILIAKDSIESPTSGITFHLQLVVGTRQSGQSPDGDARAAISGSGGLTQFAGLVPGRWYKLWRAANVAGAVEFQVPTDVSLSSAYQLPEVF